MMICGYRSSLRVSWNVVLDEIVYDDWVWSWCPVGGMRGYGCSVLGYVVMSGVDGGSCWHPS